MFLCAFTTSTKFYCSVFSQSHECATHPQRLWCACGTRVKRYNGLRKLRKTQARASHKMSINLNVREEQEV